jgi:phosphoenolpyruvate carboxykinase (ATP)
MADQGVELSSKDAGMCGLKELGGLHRNLTAPALYEHALRRGEAVVADGGALVADTGVHTGRSPKDKFIVIDDTTRDTVWWDNSNSMSPEQFAALHADMAAHAKGMSLYAQDLHGGADPVHRIKVRVFTEYAWHSLFIRNLLIRPDASELADFAPEMTIIDLPSFRADPARHGCRSETVIACDFTNRIVLIGGTSYAGEMKKSVFSMLNFLLPASRVMPMHCSANIGPKGDSAVFFGLSGTGKTTLSADASRTLIGDDEHGWSDDGIFNFEGGCYAKTINLSPENEPEIYATTKMFGTILENVPLREDRSPDFDDTRYTQNTRCSYPLHYIPNASETGKGGHPKNVVFLTADAFGVLPPISKLSPEQAMYHFISGYTAKVAGTERGVTEPQATFSACFGAPFMPLHPTVYAELLAEKIKEHGSQVWLVNTGWTGGPHGVGSRMKLSYTRRMVNAALDGELDDVEFVEEPFFGLMVPTSVPDVPDEVLNPKATWEDKAAYDEKAKALAAMFKKNFEQFKDRASEDILSGGPKV